MDNKKKKDSLLKNDSTRLRFSVWVMIANFIMGIVGMIVGADLTALGVFLAMSNTPLYAYILGRTFRGATIPDDYYRQPHSGSGGIVNRNNDDEEDSNYNYDDEYSFDGEKRNKNRTQSNDDYNIPISQTVVTNKPTNIKEVKKDKSEIG